MEGGVFFRETGLFEEEDIFSRQAAKTLRVEEEAEKLRRLALLNRKKSNRVKKIGEFWGWR